MEFPMHWLIIAVIVLILFGGRKIPELMRGLGEGVRGFKEGDRVVSETAAVIDENSPFVHRGLYNLDPGRRGFGFGLDGAMTHYAKVPERILHHIPRHAAL